MFSTDIHLVLSPLYALPNNKQTHFAFYTVCRADVVDTKPQGMQSHVVTRCVQDMAVYETYIMGMLTNFDAGMPLDRIHNMLKMFVVDPPYDKPADQLSAFLGRLVADEKLVMQGDLFRKRSSTI